MLFAATVSAGLMAGIYYAFSCAVMLGLREVTDATFVETMQRINEKIINAWFLPVFFGSFLLPIAAAILLAIDGETDVLRWAIAGAVLATISFVITASRNVPLNNALDQTGPVESIGDLAAVRSAYEEPWIRWNLYRAVASTLALIALIGSVMLYQGG